MSELQIFSNPDFGKIRTIQQGEKALFCASDIARSLGYSNPNKAVNDHCRAITKCSTPISGKMQDINFIPEGDVYRLIVHSKLPSAEKFEHWVFDTVLPSIRKNGGYISGQETLSDAELMAKAVLVAQRTIDEKNRVIEQQRQKIEADRPKTIFADAVSTSKSSILIGDLAKLICQNGYQIGQKRLFQWMRDNGYLIKRKGAEWNMPTQKSMEMGLFEIKESTHINGNGCNVITRTPKVTGKAQIYFVNKFLGRESH